jgi:hypothetical protein
VLVLLLVLVLENLVVSASRSPDVEKQDAALGTHKAFPIEQEHEHDWMMPRKSF